MSVLYEMNKTFQKKRLISEFFSSLQSNLGLVLALVVFLVVQDRTDSILHIT